ncbi:hypothetical protein RJT34_29278 [Clitoria ternatea]|uniref:GRAM domain-containing protein n=1 Tax=Clitoria ternatea TaxID=43366 RepID=A0AAN9FBX5_CLITE
MNNHREITVTASAATNNSNNPYVYISPVLPSSAAANRSSPMDTAYGALKYYSKVVGEATAQAENLVGNIWNHLRTGSNPADAAVTTLIKGTKIIFNGGPDKLFQQMFGSFPGEKLLHPYACYILTSAGPVIGTLYITNKRLAFCSDNPLNDHPFSLQHQCIYYKVVVQLDQLSTVSPSTNNRLKPTEKYIQVATVDGYEFIFLGFLSYEKALKTLQQYGNHSTGNFTVPLL